MKVKDIVFVAIFAAFLCIMAPFSIPVGPIPLSLATLAVYLSAASLGWKRGTLAVVVYILVGAIGFPVFASFSGGVQIIAGVTGGYIVGYIPCAAITGLILDRVSRRWFVYPLAMAAGTAACYLLGTAWFMLQTQAGIVAALLTCVVPFLIGDVLKIVIASLIAPRLYAITVAKRGQEQA